MRKHHIALALAAACALLAMLTAGCTRKTPEEKIRERAEMLLQSKVDGKWGQVYDLYDADYRKTITRENFVGRSRNMQFTGFAIESVEVMPSEKEAVVRATEEVTVQAFQFSSPVKAQRWIKADDGKWYLKVEDPLNPFMQMFQKKTGK
jgi:hypothetical protein